ncbi:MAG: hypothetical protein GKR86_01010 [Ilumatobacter sp.]|nr:hypothetical protein [Ilumatobacter sp.]
MPNKVEYGPGVYAAVDKASEQATLCYLVKTMPLKQLCDTFGTMLAHRPDLDGRTIQELQRRINDLAWPLVTIDQDDRDRVRNSV